MKPSLFIPVMGAAAFYDKFDRPDGTNIGAPWKEIRGDVQLAGGHVQNLTATAAGSVISAPCGSDGIFKCNVSFLDTTTLQAMYLIFRMSDADNYWFLRMSRLTADLNPTTELRWVLNGVFQAPLSQRTTIAAAAGQVLELKVEARGNIIKAWVDGAVFGSSSTYTTPDNSLNKNTSAGIRMTTGLTTQWADNFSYEP